ncbi:MAG: Fic family protein [Neisseriaceae bacterium]|nr:Fic family protein [Neisseriaceae bacterium]
MFDLDLSQAVHYHYEQFPPNNLDYSPKLIDNLVKATEAIARYDQMLKNLHNSEILLAPLRHQEAVISSRMEGTISTLDEILQYEADFGEHEMPTEVRSDIIETVLYQRALKNAQKAMKDGYPFGKSLIKTLHQQLLSFGRGATKSPGQFKQEQNYLADRNRKNILFVPISPEKLEHGLDNLFDYINQKNIPVLLRTAVAHLEFEALHPFQDGNGRIGRMLITLMLWQEKVISEPYFYISGYFEEHKDEYSDLMRRVSKNNDWTAWCVFFLQAVVSQATYNLQIAQNISDLYEQMKPIFSNTLNSKWAMQVLDFVFTYPVFRGNQLNEKTDISPASANRFLRTLHNENILMVKEESSGRRAALYSFEPMMKLVRV